MPDLEKQIAEWRRQMLAAGIKTPVPLEELESHLREDIEQQMRSGVSAHEAIEAAVQRVGLATELKSQFQIANSNQRMNRNLITVLVSIATLAIGMGFILPGVAKWRAGETFDAMAITLFLAGVAIFTLGVVCAVVGLFKTLKRLA